ncbi:MAG: citrate lyase acyl carrier protein [Ruminococcaceae bacterium]|nr:citrate lyase acyl carrier protein [Oscillospiraceae bacterium]
MIITKYASSGTLESSDAYVEIEPSKDGIKIEIESVVYKQFGENIKKVANEVLGDMDVKSAVVRITDKGALECVLRARIETAVLRGGEN